MKNTSKEEAEKLKKKNILKKIAASKDNKENTKECVLKDLDIAPQELWVQSICPRVITPQNEQEYSENQFLISFEKDRKLRLEEKPIEMTGYSRLGDVENYIKTCLYATLNPSPPKSTYKLSLTRTEYPEFRTTSNKNTESNTNLLECYNSEAISELPSLSKVRRYRIPQNGISNFQPAMLSTSEILREMSNISPKRISVETSNSKFGYSSVKESGRDIKEHTLTSHPEPKNEVRDAFVEHELNVLEDKDHDVEGDRVIAEIKHMRTPSKSKAMMLKKKKSEKKPIAKTIVLPKTANPVRAQPKSKFSSSGRYNSLKSGELSSSLLKHPLSRNDYRSLSKNSNS